MYTNNNKKSRSNSEYWTKKNELAQKAKLHTEKMKEKYCKEIAEATTQSVIYHDTNFLPEHLIHLKTFRLDFYKKQSLKQQS